MQDFLGELLDRIEQTGANFSERAFEIVGGEIVPLLNVMF
ncbi:MAG: conjugal transfer protein TrbL, partial [Mesorhizobium sp.]